MAKRKAPTVAQTAPKPFVFVLMPFDSDFDDVYHLGIRPAAEAAGAYCERVDEQIFDESILDRIYNQISKADLIVADMSRRNPNVFYEVGYAHALGKRVVLLTQKADDIPFDLKHYPHIVYEGKIMTLQRELAKRIGTLISSASETVLLAEPMLYFQGEAVEEGGSLGVGRAGTRYTLQFDLFNPTNRIIPAGEFRYFLITDSEFVPDNQKATPLPDSRLLHHLPLFGELLPGSWASVDISLGFPRVPQIAPVAIRTISRAGTRDRNVTITCAKEPEDTLSEGAND